MIESMPVIREVELTPEDWQSKTQEEREKILGRITMNFCTPMKN